MVQMDGTMLINTLSLNVLHQVHIQYTTDSLGYSKSRYIRNRYILL